VGRPGSPPFAARSDARTRRAHQPDRHRPTKPPAPSTTPKNLVAIRSLSAPSPPLPCRAQCPCKPHCSIPTTRGVLDQHAPVNGLPGSILKPQRQTDGPAALLRAANGYNKKHDYGGASPFPPIRLTTASPRLKPQRQSRPSEPVNAQNAPDDPGIPRQMAPGLPGLRGYIRWTAVAPTPSWSFAAWPACSRRPRDPRRSPGMACWPCPSRVFRQPHRCHPPRNGLPWDVIDGVIPPLPTASRETGVPPRRRSTDGS